MSSILQSVSTLAAAGIIGGLVNCLLAKEFANPAFDSVTRAWRPGWLGNLAVGGFAAIVVGGLSGPLASLDIDAPDDAVRALKVFEVAAAVLVGIGGGSILTQLANRQNEDIVKRNLIEAVRASAHGGIQAVPNHAAPAGQANQKAVQ